MGEQVPVGIPEAVDALLHITHDKAPLAPGLALPKQREEIVPLYVGCILELVQQEVFIPDTELLIHERGVRAVDDVSQDSVGFIQAHQILLLQQGLELPVELSGKAEAECQGVDYECRGICTVGLIDIGGELRVFGKEPFARHLYEVAGAHIKPVRLKGRREIPYDGYAGLADFQQALLCESLRIVRSGLLRELAMLFGLEKTSHLVEAVVYAQALALLQAFGDAGLYP